VKIKLDNLDCEDGFVLITCEDREAARDDQSIAGAHWEVPGDLLVAYAMPVDHQGLVEKLEEDGYELDLDDYCPPE